MPTRSEKGTIALDIDVALTIKAKNAWVVFPHLTPCHPTSPQDPSVVL
jgi:hypothetical protein